MVAVIVKIALADTKVYESNLMEVLEAVIANTYVVWFEVIEQVAAIMHGFELIKELKAHLDDGLF